MKIAPVEIIHKFTPTATPGTGACTNITWSNDQLMKHLRKLFGCTKHERITAITVSKHGIQATFEMVKVK